MRIHGYIRLSSLTATNERFLRKLISVNVLARKALNACVHLSVPQTDTGAQVE